MAVLALSSLLAAMYTLAFLDNNACARWWTKDQGEQQLSTKKRVHLRNTLTVSFPMPVFPPVTTTTFPVKSGIS